MRDRDRPATWGKGAAPEVPVERTRAARFSARCRRQDALGGIPGAVGFTPFEACGTRERCWGLQYRRARGAWGPP